MKSTVTVIVGASTYNLTTLDYMISELQLTDPTQAEQDLLTRHIEEVSASIAKYCDRVFPTETVEETIWFTRADFRPSRIGHAHFVHPLLYSNTYGSKEALKLRRYPIQNIERIVVDGEVVLDTYELPSIDAEDVFRLDGGDEDNGQVYRVDGSGYLSVWSFGKTAVFTYTGGYDIIPADLERAARLWVASAWFSAGQDSMTQREEVYGIASVTYQNVSSSKTSTTGVMPSEVSLLLQPYKREGFAFA